MWELLDVAEGIGTIGESTAPSRGAAEGTRGASDDPDEHPGPVVPAPPPPRLPDTGWDDFAPESKDF